MTDIAKDAVTACIAEWERLGVARSARDEMAEELRADLGEAEADGVGAEAYLGEDPRAFARRWAEERDLVHPRRYLLTTAVLAILGGVPGAGLGLFFAYGLSSATFKEAFGTLYDPGPGFTPHYIWDPPVLLILGLYVFAGICAAAGAVLAVRAFLRWRHDPALHETATLAALGVLPAAALAIYVHLVRVVPGLPE